jgi:hypothetical protein
MSTKMGVTAAKGVCVHNIKKYSGRAGPVYGVGAGQRIANHIQY